MRSMIAVACIVLAGCATSLRHQAHELINSGNPQAAIPVLQQAIQNGQLGAWNDLGVAYQRTGQRDLAVRAYTVAARYGNTTAQQNLVLLGEPVPPTDLANVLANQRAANAANTAATLQFLQATQPSTATCTTMPWGLGTRVTCR